jgi:hypothetical protein
VRVQHQGGDKAAEVEVFYVRGGVTHRVRGRGCVLACWNSVIPYLCPELPAAQRAALARAQMSEFGSVVSFDLRAGAEAGRRFAEALRLFAITASLGSTESLVLPPQLIGSRDLTPEQAAERLRAL